MSLFDPDDPKELRTTLNQLFEETAKHVGVTETRRLLKRAFEWQDALEGGATFSEVVCEGCGKPMPKGTRRTKRFHNSSCRMKASRRASLASQTAGQRGSKRAVA